MTKTAIVTGILGQDASILTEYLLEKDYVVNGIYRRVSTGTNFNNIESIRNHPRLNLIEGSITDPTFMADIISGIKPDELYGLAAQSHVGMSFKIPTDTFRINAESVILQLDLIKNFSPHTRYYNAATSEMLGGLNCPSEGYDENTILNPRSPYAIAKVAAYNSVKMYRVAYGLFACNGILFNHSCISKRTPIFVRQKGIINCIVPEDLLKFGGKEESKSLISENIEIWDGFNWEDLNTITVRPVDDNNSDFNGTITNCCDGIVATTAHHNLLDSHGRKVRADHCKLDDKLLSGRYPIHKSAQTLSVTLEEAELIGFIVGDGWIHKDKIRCNLSNNSDEYVDRIDNLWSSISDKGIRVGKFIKHNGEITGRSRLVFLNGFEDWDLSGLLRAEIYNFYSEKKVPDFILNASVDIQEAFLNGYNMADGLKANKCSYRFKNFKTNSQQLAQGLLYLISNVTGQTYNMTFEEKNGRQYYSINFLSDNISNLEKLEIITPLLEDGLPQRKIHRETGISRDFIRKVSKGHTPGKYHKRTRLDRNAIKKQGALSLDYVYDLETSSGKFMAGVGTIVIANSPRRGIDFATRKITSGVADIVKGKSQHIFMGDLSSFRDEGHANDYTKAMHLMLQQDEPDDYVIATGESVSIRQMLEYVCELAGLKYDDVYRMDERFMRPSDVPYLKGNPSKAREQLGWKPEYSWQDLLKEMYEHDLRQA